MDNGWVFYDGPSMLNGQPIVSIVSGIRTPSSNADTGPMAQTWILHQASKPHIAVKTGDDASICGNCKLRGKECYVVTFQGPRAIYDEWVKGKYKPNPSKALLKLASARPVRLGSYGDPAAVPYSVWERLIDCFPRHTGYTHQWRGFERFQKICQASCDNLMDFEEAKSRGWRTFTIVPKEIEPEGLGMHCTKDAFKWKRCIDCLVCDGQTADAWIHVHGRRNMISGFHWPERSG